MLGGGVIQLGVERLDDELLAAIRALPSVHSAQRLAAPAPAATVDREEVAAVPTDTGHEPALLKIEARRSQDALIQAVGCLNQRDIAFTSVEIFEPNLESVFLHLTGKKLRE